MYRVTMQQATFPRVWLSISPAFPLDFLQDTVEELGAMGTNAVDDFDWLVQLRYYIEDFSFGNWMVLDDFWRILTFDFVFFLSEDG